MYGNGRAAVWMDPRGKSDFDAGLLFFAAAARMMPGLTWEDIQRPQLLAGWWTDLKHSVGDVKDGIGDVLKSTVDVIGGKTGEAVRLASDPKVADTVSRAGAAYATGGASEGAKGALDAIMSIFTPTGVSAVEAAGASYKQSYGIDWSNPWVIGAGVTVGGLTLIALVRAVSK